MKHFTDVHANVKKNEEKNVTYDENGVIIPSHYLEIQGSPQTRPQWDRPWKPLITFHLKQVKKSHMFAANLNGMLYISKSTSAEEVTSSSWAEARASRTKPGQLSAKDLIR